MSYSGRCVWPSLFVLLVVGVGIGIAIGYFAIANNRDDSCASQPSATSQPGKHPMFPHVSFPYTALKENTTRTSAAPVDGEVWFTIFARYEKECAAQLQLAKTCQPPLPRYYIATRKAGNLSIDGRLDDDAWGDAPWTEDFYDIRGTPPDFPGPDQETRVKVIYDDTHVYVASRLEENHVWATYTEKDSRIYQENAFEIFFDVDNSMSWYKEFEINALGTTWDLTLSRAYLDGGDYTDWEGVGQKAVYTDGGVNNISNPSTFWSAEVSFPYTALKENTNRSSAAPVDGEVWFTIFARAEYQTRENSTTGQYEQVPGTEASWWSWNPTGAVALHLPNRWGLLYFTSKTAQQMKSEPVKMTFPRWPVFYGLFHIFEVMQTFKSLHGMYVADERQVRFAPYVHDCSSDFTLRLTGGPGGGGFEASLAMPQVPGVGHIDHNRRVWFT